MITFNETVPAQQQFFHNSQWIITQLPNNRWCLVLSGLLNIDFFGGQDAGWRQDTIQIIRDINPLFIYANFDPINYYVTLNVEQYACYGSVCRFWDRDESVNAGFAVDSFYPFFSGGGRAFGSQSGVYLDVGVSDRDAHVVNVGYHLMAIGTISQVPIIPVG
jgi:hypothetical protein